MAFKIIEKFRLSFYIIIPIGCILFWAFVALAKDDFTPIPAADLDVIYYATEYVFNAPEKLYIKQYYHGEDHYVYTPFLVILLWPMGLLAFELAHWYYFFFVLILSTLSIILFNQILIHKKVTNKFHRFLYLIAISNGIVYVQAFDILGGRVFMTFGLIWFLNREIKFRALKLDMADTKFIFTQMMILMFVFGITLQYVFLVILYIFHNVKFKEIFSIFQIKRYLLITVSFLIQNFILIVILFIAPEGILNFLGGHWRGERSLGVRRPFWTYSFILENRPKDPVDLISTTLLVLSFYYDLSGLNLSILMLSLLIMSIITFLIHLNKNLTIENKFGLWALFSLFFYTFTQIPYFVGLLPLITILFINYEIEMDKNLIVFIKKNFLILTGLICIMVIYFLPPIHYLIRVFPFLMHIPVPIILFKFTYVFSILAADLYLLYRKNRINLNKSMEMRKNF